MMYIKRRVFEMKANKTRKLLNHINMACVRGEISQGEYFNFIESLNDYLPNAFKIIKKGGI